MGANIQKRVLGQPGKTGIKVNLRDLLAKYFDICEEGDEDERQRFLALHKENGALMSLIEMRDQLLGAINEVSCHASAGR